MARIVGRIYGALGLVADGHLVRDRRVRTGRRLCRADRHQDQSITKTLGGVLFIDGRAYGVIRNDFGVRSCGHPGQGMEDNRDG